ncbi:hypothetical protein ACFL6K_03675 [Candidatus Latescibacterota bacterium]
MNKDREIGYWVLMIGGILLLAMLLSGQMMSFINYDFTVSFGLQESEDVIGESGVALNKGFGVGDTLIYTPLMIIGLIGLWRKKVWGVFAMTGSLAITAYWPMVTIFILLFSRGTPGFNFTDFTLYNIVLTSITLFGIWGVWYLYKNRKILAKD